MEHNKLWLICDAGLPLCGGGILREELLLYNIPSSSIPALTAEFASLTGKKLDPDSDISILSGGQKVILMCLCALFSPARRIRFIELWHSLDDANRVWARELIARLQNDRQISFSEDGHAGP